MIFTRCKIIIKIVFCTDGKNVSYVLKSKNLQRNNLILSLIYIYVSFNPLNHYSFFLLGVLV